MQTLINTRADLDAISGAVDYATFMATLRGTLWRLEKDDNIGSWRAIEDNSTIQRFGFTRADFPDAQPPALPEYVSPPNPVPAFCSRRQGQRALLQSNKLDAVEASIASIADPVSKRQAQIEYEAGTWERGNAFLQSMWANLGGTEAELDDLFRLAVTL